MKIANLITNVSTKKGETRLHLYVTLDNDQYQGLAGHLLSVTLSGAGEFMMDTVPGAKVEQSLAPEVELNFYDFKKSMP